MPIIGRRSVTLRTWPNGWKTKRTGDLLEAELREAERKEAALAVAHAQAFGVEKVAQHRASLAGSKVSSKFEEIQAALGNLTPQSDLESFKSTMYQAYELAQGDGADEAEATGAAAAAKPRKPLKPSPKGQPLQPGVASSSAAERLAHWPP